MGSSDGRSERPPQSGAADGRSSSTEQRIHELEQEVARLKELELELRASSERLGRVVESAMDAIITVDAQQRVVLFNAAAEAMFKCRAEDTLGKSIDPFIPERFRPAHAQHIENFGKTGATTRAMGALGTLRAVRSDGEEFPIEATISQTKVGGQALFTVILRDVTERQHSEQERERLYREAQQAIRAREEFISMASHDMRAPLSAIQLQLYRVLREAEKKESTLFSPGWVRERLERTTASVDRAVQLMDNLLEQSRSSAGELELRLTEVDLWQVVRELCARAKEQLEGAGAKLELSGAATVGRWDRLRLEQVFSNLLTNAIKYGAGKPIAVSVERRGNTAQLVVRDQGIGIAPDDLHNIFQRYRRATSQGSASSFGLGLWISRRLVGALGGNIVVDSTPGEGSTFTVTLPISGPVGMLAEGETDGRQLILVVDDDDDLRDTVLDVLRAEGYAVQGEPDGGRALEFLRRSARTPHLILLDLMMPGINGWEFKRQIELDPRLAEIPVVVMSASRNVEAQPIRATEILAKPLSLDAVLAIIQKHLPKVQKPVP